MFFRSQLKILAQILLIGSVSLGAAGALSAEENEIAKVSEAGVHQLEVDRVLSVPLAGTFQLDEEDFSFSKQGRVRLSQKENPSESKSQNSVPSISSESHLRAESFVGKNCFSISLPAVDFKLNSIFSLSVSSETSDSNLARFQGIIKNSSSPNFQNKPWEQIGVSHLSDLNCPLFVYFRADKNFCSSEADFLAETILGFDWRSGGFVDFQSEDSIGKPSSYLANFEDRIVAGSRADIAPSVEIVKGRRRIGDLPIAGFSFWKPGKNSNSYPVTDEKQRPLVSEEISWEFLLSKSRKDISPQIHWDGRSGSSHKNKNDWKSIVVFLEKLILDSPVG
ncbi:hypothetical protein [Leptospira adleri]|uniref:hypothetical protein n=1 Tax=Leptospira adleri TaxID=2023186 RepID=UPI001083643D|nr:hypothetical protein [Leptospira adleri]TGM58797.1 hypothetical protein EHQ97_06850 [Leptospira adleri]